MRYLSKSLLMLFAFAVPWEYSLDLGEPFGNVARIVGLLLLLVAVPGGLLAPRFRRPGAVSWLVLAFYLYFVCSYFWTVDPLATTEKMRAYFQVTMAVWLVWQLAASAADLRGLLRAFVVGCWVLAALTFADFTSASAVAAEQARFVATGQDPNDVARFLDLGFPIAALLFVTEKRLSLRLLALAYLPAGILAVLLTASRGGVTAAIAGVFGVAFLIAKARPRAAFAVSALLSAAVAALWFLVPASVSDRLATIPQEIAGGDWNERFSIWDAGWQAFRQSPWLGYGAGSFTTAAGLSPGDTAHNTAMALLVTGGLFGTAIFSAILAAVAWSVAQTRGLLQIALATVLLVWGITSMVGSVEENRTTWLLFAIMALAGRLAVERPVEMEAHFAADPSPTTPVPLYASM